MHRRRPLLVVETVCSTAVEFTIRRRNEVKLWLIAIAKFLSRAIPKFLVNRGVLKLTGKRSLMLISFVFLIYDSRQNASTSQVASTAPVQPQ